LGLHVRKKIRGSEGGENRGGKNRNRRANSSQSTCVVTGTTRGTLIHQTRARENGVWKKQLVGQLPKKIGKRVMIESRRPEEIRKGGGKKNTASELPSLAR